MNTDTELMTSADLGDCELCNKEFDSGDYCKTIHNHCLGDDIVCCRCWCAANPKFHCPDAWRYLEEEEEEEEEESSDDESDEEESEIIELKIESDRPFEDPKDMKEFVRYKLKEGKTRAEGCKWIQENYIGYGFRMSGNIFDVFVGKE